MDKFNIVGKNQIRQDGFEKVTGEALFGDDYKFPNLLHAVMVRTKEDHAIIKKINYDKIKDEKNVFIIDHNDVPAKKKIGVIKEDQPIFAYEKIVTRGDVVAMLVGEDIEKLEELRDKVEIKCESLPKLTDPELALDNDAILIHPELKTNLIIHYPLRKGNIEEGFSKSDHILKQEYKTQLIEHAYIEPEVVVAIPLEGNRGVKVIGSIQNPHTARRVISQVLGIPLTKVRIIQADMGGSFGGKDDTMCFLSARAAIAALKLNRPVKIKYKREESILESYKRHPYRLKYKVGFSDNGKINAMKIDILADGGAYASMSPFVTWRSVVQATGPYEIENVETDVRAVYTNNPYTGAMRGFGSPQPIFAEESLLDEIAIKLNLDPIEIRKINGVKAGSITATGQKLKDHSVNLISVLEKASSESDFLNKWKINSKQESNRFFFKEINQENIILNKDDFIEPNETLKKGIGLAVSLRGCSLGAEGIDAAAAYLSLQNDGSTYLLSGLAENGQGLKTTFSIVAAEVLGIEIEQIHYLDHDTYIVPDSGPTVASRSTLMGGGAVKNAAEIVRKRLEELLITEWNLPNDSEFIFKNNLVTLRNDLTKKIEFKNLTLLAYQRGISLATIGWYKGPHVSWDEEQGQGDAYFTYVYGCQVAEVTVNISTGQVLVDKIIAVHDAGKIINILGALGQVYGGVTQGAGYGILEEITTENGNIRELNFDQYLIPTSMDIGEIIPHFIEGEDKYGPWGAKSLGEPTLELTAAAIANAIYNATGYRFRRIPINLEEIVCKRKLAPISVKRGSA